MLHQISYMSEMKSIPGRDMIDAIRQVSIRNNRSCGVTGLLLVDHWRFIQAIEGEEVHVRATMDRIQNDERHSRISILTDQPVSARQFGEWDMDVRSPADDADPHVYMGHINRVVQAVDDANLRAMFLGFARLTALRFSRP